MDVICAFGNEAASRFPAICTHDRHYNNTSFTKKNVSVMQGNSGSGKLTLCLTTLISHKNLMFHFSNQVSVDNRNE